MRQWSARVAVCAVAVPLLLTGCAQKHHASESLPTTSTTTTAKTLPPLGPADFPVPAEARQRTDDGVVAFSRYYIELSNHLLPTLDSAPLRDLSMSCRTCDELADGYDKAKSDGRAFEGGKLTVTGTGSVQLTGNRAEVSLTLHQDAVTVKDSSGAVIQSESVGAYNLGGGIALSWDDHRSTWIVTQLDADRQ